MNILLVSLVSKRILYFLIVWQINKLFIEWFDDKGYKLKIFF